MFAPASICCSRNLLANSLWSFPPIFWKLLYAAWSCCCVTPPPCLLNSRLPGWSIVPSKPGMPLPKFMLPRLMSMPFMPIIGWPKPFEKSMSSSAGVPGCDDSGDVRLCVFCIGTVPSVGVFTEETVGLFCSPNC